MDFKKIVSTLILIIWMILIFIFSNQNAITSEKVSDKVTSKTLTTVSEVTGKKLSDNRREELIENNRFMVRKMAHFTLYFVLGILIYTTLASYGIPKNKLIYSIILCFIFSLLDEFHQLFSYGRTSRMFDVFIDTSGSIVSSMLIFMLRHKKRYKKLDFFKKKWYNM